MSETLRNFLFTSESVTEGHPDKIADQISDAVLDEVMRQDPMGRVACETLVTTGLAVVAGEITTTAHVNYDELVRQTIRGVGYDRAKYGYDCETCAVLCTVKRQSPDIAMGVDTGGAGDQGLMFGFGVRRDGRVDAHAHPTGAPLDATPGGRSQVQERLISCGRMENRRSPLSIVTAGRRALKPW